ncbi:MAG TPA: DUF2182 domain-containing protein [Solirubrobacteraceae bacterium]|jgi:hypothetical protein|nr:DUF2182 domain-containing protein [Solirubrobacteraceae bacterium]
MTPFESTRKNPQVVAVLLAAAGLAWWWTVERMAGMGASPGTDPAAYELVPFKRACLARCRGQLEGVRGHAPGWSAALAMGARSGSWCLGCSWVLMAGLCALGMMSLTWMALIATLIALQKLSPWPRGARLATATVRAVLAAGLLAAPTGCPTLRASKRVALYRPSPTSRCCVSSCSLTSMTVPVA